MGSQSVHCCCIVLFLSDLFIIIIVIELFVHHEGFVFVVTRWGDHALVRCGHCTASTIKTIMITMIIITMLTARYAITLRIRTVTVTTMMCIVLCFVQIAPLMQPS